MSGGRSASAVAAAGISTPPGPIQVRGADVASGQGWLQDFGPGFGKRLPHVIPRRRFLIVLPIVVLTTAVVVHWSDRSRHGVTLLSDGLQGSLSIMVPAPAAADTRKPRSAQLAASASNETLPRNVAEVRDAILSAVATGRLADLRFAIELNELPPDVGQAPGQDVIAHLLAQSTRFAPVAAAAVARNEPDAPAAVPQPAQPPAAAVADGRDILEAIGSVLSARPAMIAAGRDFENNGIFVWPHFAERDWGKPLSEAEAVELRRLAGSEADAMIAQRRWSGWRIAIGADGTWHAMTRPHTHPHQD